MTDPQYYHPRATDPPVRPEPEISDRDSEAWIPGKRRKHIPVVNILTRVSIAVFVIGALAGIFFLASKMLTSYLG